MEIFELKLTETESAGVTAISLVLKPATESNFIYFSEDEEAEKLTHFKAIDEDKQLVVGAAMIPDKKIYRRDGDQEYFVYFSQDTIRQVSQKFFLDGKINSATLEHEDTLNGLTVVESWIIEDSKADKSAVYGFNLPVGTWFIMMKVNNPDIWKSIKDQQVKGFSVEGLFANQLIKNSKDMDFEKMKTEIVEAITGLLKKPEVEPEPEIKPEVKLGSIAAISADQSEITIEFPGEALEAGAAITYQVDEEAVPVPTGEYQLPDGMVLLVVEDGIAGEIREAEAEELAEEVTAEEIITKVGELLTEVLGDFSTQVDTKLAEFKAEVLKPGDKPEPHKPDTPSVDQKFRSLSQKIRESKTKK